MRTIPPVHMRAALSLGARPVDRVPARLRTADLPGVGAGVLMVFIQALATTSRRRWSRAGRPDAQLTHRLLRQPRRSTGAMAASLSLALLAGDRRPVLRLRTAGRHRQDQDGMTTRPAYESTASASRAGCSGPAPAPVLVFLMRHRRHRAAVILAARSCTSRCRGRRCALRGLSLPNCGCRRSAEQPDRQARARRCRHRSARWRFGFCGRASRGRRLLSPVLLSPLVCRLVIAPSRVLRLRPARATDGYLGLMLAHARAGAARSCWSPCFPRCQASTAPVSMPPPAWQRRRAGLPARWPARSSSPASLGAAVALRPPRSTRLWSRCCSRAGQRTLRADVRRITTTSA